MINLNNNNQTLIDLEGYYKEFSKQECCQCRSLGISSRDFMRTFVMKRGGLFSAISLLTMQREAPQELNYLQKWKYKQLKDILSQPVTLFFMTIDGTIKLPIAEQLLDIACKREFISGKDQEHVTLFPTIAKECIAASNQASSRAKFLSDIVMLAEENLGTFLAKVQTRIIP